MEFLNWFIDPVKNHYFDFEGRVGREAFWKYILIYFVIYIVLHMVSMGLATLFSLAVLLPSLSISARRLHDIDMSGWWQLIGIIPLLGLIIMIYFLVQEGSKEVNRFGPVPTDGEGTQPAPEASATPVEVVAEDPAAPTSEASEQSEQPAQEESQESQNQPPQQ